MRSFPSLVRSRPSLFSYEVDTYFGRREFFYIFREGQDVEKNLLRKSYYEISSVEIADLNHDGLTEIAVQSIDEAVSAAGTDLSMWRVISRGDLEIMDLENLFKGMEVQSGPYQISLGDHVDRSASVYTTETRYD